MLSTGQELSIISNCPACNGYGQIYIRGSGYFDQQEGRYVHEWRKCEDCNGGAQ